jgi:hypothetical protein
VRKGQKLKSNLSLKHNFIDPFRATVSTELRSMTRFTGNTFSSVGCFQAPTQTHYSGVGPS